MKKTILIVLVLCLAVEVANADFTFGEPVNLGSPINTPSGDAGFSMSADGLEVYICSDRSGGLGYIDIWCSTRENADDPWGPLVNVQEINSRYNEVFQCLSADGLTLYFSDFWYWNPAGDRPGGVGGHDLWMCMRASRNDPWGTPVNVGAPLNSGSHEISPTISHDALTFMFTSKRSGGRGDYDLWMSTRLAAESNWSPPVNMGPAVNSSAYDGEGHLSTDGLALFFSSNRGGGRGSYDVWVTTRLSQTAAWGPPVNLGPVINTSSMEGLPSLSPDQKTLYFVSDQPGGIGGWDIYEVPIVPIVDFNGDGIVDSDDTRFMLDHWRTDEPLCDVGPMPWGDGIVDAQDLMVLAEYLLLEDVRLIAHWKLEETKGVIAHNSINANHGTLSGEPLWQPSGGKVGGALEFDGIDDYISTPFILNPGKGSMGAFAWIKGGLPGQVIISQTGDFGGTWLSMDPAEGKLMTGFSDMYFGALVSETVVTDCQWHHVGLVYDMDTLHRLIYVDGVMVAEDTTVVAGTLSDDGLHVGTSKDLDAETFFSGLIDDVRIYNVALTAEQIAMLTQ
jgi:hypothetical protein